MGTIYDVLGEVRHALATGRSHDGYRQLVTLFASTPMGPVQGGSWLDDARLFAEASTLLGEAAQMLGVDKAAQRVLRAANQPNDLEALYDAATALAEERQHAAASVLLGRANRLAPGQGAIVGDLCSALEVLLRYAEAARVIAQSGLAETEPMCAYLSGYCSIMSGDLTTTRQRVAQLVSVADDTMQFLRHQLDGMLARADALTAAGLALDRRTLTAWQAVLNGTILLHESPHGYSEPMFGRYAYVSDNAALMHEGLVRLKALVTHGGSTVARVVAAPDRASHVLGLAASRLLHAPFAPWPEGADEPGLFVAWTMEAALAREGEPDFQGAMAVHRPGQILFVHASSWVDPFPYSPDVTTLVHQTITNPWTGGQLREDPSNGTLSRAAPDPRSDEELAEEVLDSALDVDNGSVSPLEHVLSVSDVLKALPAGQTLGLHRTQGARLIQRAGGPVPSSRFL